MKITFVPLCMLLYVASVCASGVQLGTMNVTMSNYLEGVSFFTKLLKLIAKLSFQRDKDELSFSHSFKKKDKKSANYPMLPMAMMYPMHMGPMYAPPPPPPPPIPPIYHKPPASYSHDYNAPYKPAQAYPENSKYHTGYHTSQSYYNPEHNAYSPIGHQQQSHPPNKHQASGIYGPSDKYESKEKEYVKSHGSTYSTTSGYKAENYKHGENYEQQNKGSKPYEQSKTYEASKTYDASKSYEQSKAYEPSKAYEHKETSSYYGGHKPASHYGGNHGHYNQPSNQYGYVHGKNYGPMQNYVHGKNYGPAPAKYGKPEITYKPFTNKPVSYYRSSSGEKSGKNYKDSTRY